MLRAGLTGGIGTGNVSITGTGALTKSGAGALNLTAASTYTGSTFLDSGTVNLTGSAVMGTNTNGTSMRLANSAGSNVKVSNTTTTPRRSFTMERSRSILTKF